MFWIGLIVGLIVGTFIGVTIMSLCQLSKEYGGNNNGDY